MPEPVLGREIGDAGRFLHPRVPHHHVAEVVARDRVAGLAVLEDRDGARGRVDAVGFGGDGDRGGGLGFGGGGVDFVDVGGGLEAGEGGGGDVLFLCVNIISGKVRGARREGRTSTRR